MNRRYVPKPRQNLGDLADTIRSRDQVPALKVVADFPEPGDPAVRNSFDPRVHDHQFDGLQKVRSRIGTLCGTDRKQNVFALGIQPGGRRFLRHNIG